MAATLKVLSENNIGSVRDLEKQLQLLAGSVAKLEFSQQSLNSEITKLQQIHGALCNYNAYSHIAEQYKSKVFFRDKFFRENEEQLRAYAKAQKILSMYPVSYTHLYIMSYKKQAIVLWLILSLYKLSFYRSIYWYIIPGIRCV